MGYWAYGGGGDQGGSYWVPDNENDAPTNTGLTQQEVTQSFQNLLGRAPNEADLQSWVGWGGDYADKDRQLYTLQRDITTLPEYRQVSQPFYDPNVKEGSFLQGVDYFKDKGYTPSGNYEGVPTAFYDPSGNLAAWYGDIGIENGRTYRPNITEDYGWHSANELSKISNAVPVYAHENPDTQGWLGGGQWIAPVAMMGALAGAALLAPAAAGAAGAAGAGEAGALAGGLGAAEAGAGGLSALEAASLMGGTLSDAGAAAMMGGTLSDIGLAAQALGYTTASDAIAAGLMTPEGVTTALGMERLAELGAPLASDGVSFGDVVKNVNRARSAINNISKLTGEGSGGALGTSGYGGAGYPLGGLSINAPQFVAPTSIAPSTINRFMTSAESPSQVEARGLKFGDDIAKIPQMDMITPELRGMLFENLRGEQNPFIRDPLGALDRGEMSFGFRRGGHVMNEDGEPHIPEFITGKTGHYVDGRGTGQSDEIPAMLADGEYVIDADTVAALGDGSSKAGSELLDKFREAIREHKRSAPVDKIPPKASPLQYMKVALKEAGRLK